LGTSFASAVAGVILAQMTTEYGGFALPAENGFKVVMALGAGAALAAFLLAGFIPKRGAAVVAAAPEEAQEAMPVKA
ncbi:MFS transporter, partial [Streptomyces turgidiscabies]